MEKNTKIRQVLTWPLRLFTLLLIVGFTILGTRPPSALADSIHTCHFVWNSQGNTSLVGYDSSAFQNGDVTMGLLETLQGFQGSGSDLSGYTFQGNNAVYSLQCDGTNPYPNGCMLVSRGTDRDNTPLFRGNLVQAGSSWIVTQLDRVGLNC